MTIVTLCDYITAMKQANKPFAYPRPGGGMVLSVREAKAHFSAALARAAAGAEIVIAWHGRPRARLVPLRSEDETLRVDRAWLKSMTVCGRGTRAEKLVRTDRDARG